MKAIGLIFVVYVLVQWCVAYNAYPRSDSSSYSSYSAQSQASYTGKLTSSSSSTDDSAHYVHSCCQLTSWAFANMDEVRQFANRLRQEFNSISQGSKIDYDSSYITPWSENILKLTGKTPEELDSLCHNLSEQLVTDMRHGLIQYTTIAQPNFFEWKAAESLQFDMNSFTEYRQQKQQQQQQKTLIDINHYQPVDLSNYDEVKNYAYPVEVKVIDGKTYVVHKNCTEASKTTGEGTFESPKVSILQKNHTITTNTLPLSPISSPISDSMTSKISSSAIHQSISTPQKIYLEPPVSSSTSTRKKTIYDWANQNMEPSVLGYNPVVTVGSELSGNINAYNPPIHIPVDSNVESFISDSQLYRPIYMHNYNPGSSTVTLRHYNKTVITNPDGSNTVKGSEVNKKWVDGKLIFDNERPFGEWSLPRDEAWKREEREQFFWFLTQGATIERLEAWQRQQEERLLAVAARYHTTVDTIQEWHRQELERYRVLLGQYQAQINDKNDWERIERGRLDWLIHQNSFTRTELERWQRENEDRLTHLAHQYKTSLEDLKKWQMEELNRLYIYFNNQNNSMMLRPAPGTESLQVNEQERLQELIRQHNATIAQLQNSIKMDQQKLVDISQTYRGNVQDMEKWLKEELARLTGIVNEKRKEMNRITEWQHSERERLENIVNQHRGSIADLESQITRDRQYINTLAFKYHVSIEELEKWQRSELERLQKEGSSKLESEIKNWLKHEREHLASVIKKNNMTIEEFQAKIISDRSRLEDLAKTYKIQVSEVEEWIKSEIKNFHSDGLLKGIEKELAIWQQKERDRLLSIVEQNEFTIGELEKKLKDDQTHLYKLANTYQVRVEEIEEWLKKELLRLQSEGLIKVEDIKDWQKNEREEILKIVQQNKLTIEEFENRLLTDKKRLEELSKAYNVQTSEIESWIKKEGERLQKLGLLQMQEHLNHWQKIERDRLLALVNQNNLSMEELEERIRKDQVHLYSLAHQHQVQVEEIEEWIKKEIKKLQEQGIIEMSNLKDWQSEWRGNLTNMIKERDFTVEKFHKWLLEDREHLQALAMQHNLQIEEVEQWVRNEEQRFVSMGLLKPNEKLTNWQEVERRYLERITQDQYHSTEQLEQRLRQDRELLEKLARDYSVQVEQIEQWMKKELARLRDEGQLQIDNLTAWQIAERERLEKLIKENEHWSVEEFEDQLRKDHDHMQTMAFQYHTSVAEVEKWIRSEVDRLQVQGKLDIEKLTNWQKEEQYRIVNLLQQQTNISVEDFEQKVRNDRKLLMNLANQYHVSVVEVENYVKKVIEELREKGKFEVQNLQTWQIVERDYIKQLLSQYNNILSTSQYQEKLLADRSHLRQLADQYRINIDQIEKWMIEELHRLRQDSENQVQQLSAWQIAEVQRLKDIIRQNNHLSYVEFEVELLKERSRIQDLANQYALSVEQIEQWLRQQLLNLKSSGQVQVESLMQWQEEEQKRLIDMLLQQQTDINFEEFELQLRQNNTRLQQLAQRYSISVEQIENWVRDELKRLKNTGLLKVEELTTWQREERNRLQEWLSQQNSRVTYEELIEFLKRDKERLSRIANDYHLTAQEVESWVDHESARLQLLGLVQRPQKVIIWNNNLLNNNEMWKVHTRAHLQAIAQVKHMNFKDFEQYLSEERRRWEQFARQYNITVEEIEEWLRDSAQKFMEMGLIEGTVIVHEWQTNEKLYIQNLINDRLRKQQQWSIEELERQLKNDQEHLQRLASQYHITIEQIMSFYDQELNLLLNQRKIISEHLADWQRREKYRIYWHVVRQPEMNLQVLEKQLLEDKSTLNGLADEYQLTIKELEYFIKNELRRLLNLGLVLDTSNTINSQRWQQYERERLRAIAAEITLTEEEFLDFIASDHSYQQHLTKMYGCSLEQLAPFQRIEINTMQREGLLDNIRLLTLEKWQKREGDRLYSLIKNQNFSLKNLKDWQRQDIFLTELAAKYGIELQTLKNWQLNEYERLVRLAEQYQMTLNQLQDFRDKELRYLNFVMHKNTSSQVERSSWQANEVKRMRTLQLKTGLSGKELLLWRRRLYLLCQGLIPMDFSGYGGHEIGVGTTNRTGIPQQIISKDRGDQPPNIYEESLDEREPGLERQDPLYPQPSAQIRQTTTHRPQQYLQATPIITMPQGMQESGYRYTKKEYRLTVPSLVASSSATANFNGGAVSLNTNPQGDNSFHNFKDFESYSLTTLHHQDQNYHQNKEVHVDSADNISIMRNKLEHPTEAEYDDQLVEVSLTDAKTESSSFWSKLKKKTTDLMG